MNPYYKCQFQLNRNVTRRNKKGKELERVRKSNGNSYWPVVSGKSKQRSPWRLAIRISLSIRLAQYISTHSTNTFTHTEKGFLALKQRYVNYHPIPEKARSQRPPLQWRRLENLNVGKTGSYTEWFIRVGYSGKYKFFA